MKNSILFLILISLLGVAYYLDQREDVVDLRPKREKGEKVFSLNLNDLREIHLPNTKLKNFKNQWRVMDVNYSVDRPLLERVINRFNNIHVLKEIKVDKEVLDDFFKKQNHFIKLLSFEDNIEVRLGDVSDITGHFYMEIYLNQKKALYLCHDTTFFQGFYSTEEQANLQRYLAFKNLVLLKPFDLIQRNIFKDINPKEIASLNISNLRGNDFTLNFINKTTKPVTPKEIRVVNLIKSMEMVRDNLKFDSFIKFEDQILDRLVSEIEVKTVSDEFKFELYAMLDRKGGYFLKYNKDSERIYEFNPSSIHFFTSKLSDFWVRKLELPPTKFKDSFNMEMSRDGKRWFKFEVYDLNQFKVRSLSKEVVASKSISNYDLLFNLIFSQNDYKNAENVKKLSEKELNKLTRGQGTYVRLLNRTIYLTKKDVEFYLIDLDKHLLFNYIKNSDRLPSFGTNHFFQSISK